MGRQRPSLSGRRPSHWQIDWNIVVHRAKEIVESYDTPVTLRQLYYRIVSEGLIPNKQQSYKTLSAKTAAARREGWFPDLVDRTREIERYLTFGSPDEAMESSINTYRRDRTEGQEYSIYIGVEKHGLTLQLMHWFGDLGIPVIALGGYSSQTFVDVVANDIARQNRTTVLIYAGDFDPSGMDIPRDFCERVGCFDEVRRVALDRKLIDKFDLPPMPGKDGDSRSARFMLEHGELIQVELDALPPDELRKLYTAAIKKFFDYKVHDKAKATEDSDVKNLKRAFNLMDKTDATIAAEYLASTSVKNGGLEEMVKKAAGRMGYDLRKKRRKR